MLEFRLQYADDCWKTCLQFLEPKIPLSLLQIKWTERNNSTITFSNLKHNNSIVRVRKRDYKIDESSCIPIEPSITREMWNRERISRRHSNRRCRKLITVPDRDVVKNTGGGPSWWTLTRDASTESVSIIHLHVILSRSIRPIHSLIKV